MTDIVVRLRKWYKDVNAVSAIDLMDEAASEIARLRLELYMRPVPNILVQAKEKSWISVEERLPEIAPLGVTATVIVAHAEYDANREPTGNVKVSPASFLGSDQQGPFFKSMINGRRLYTNAWMPLPEPPK